jgi:phosphoglycerate dehydrogenase-like enzyme
MSKPKVWYTQPESSKERIFTPDQLQRMIDSFDVTQNDTGRALTTEELADGIAGFDGIVTGWGSHPPITAEVMENADRLKIIAHAAGTIKHMVSGEVVEQYLVPRDIILFSANVAIAYNVAESTVGMLLMASHCWPQFADNFRRTGVWRPPSIRGNARFLMGSVVGVVSASKVGREVIRLLSVWPLDILLYDPYVSDQDAAEMGVEKVELDELFARSDHVTVHSPSIPETRHMIGADQLRKLRDGATFVNTSRGSVIDHAALIAEAATGRIHVVLDVTDPEPLPIDSPFRCMPNVHIVPHLSGAGFYGYHMIGRMTVDALEAAFAGQPVDGAVNYSLYDVLA